MATYFYIDKCLIRSINSIEPISQMKLVKTGLAFVLIFFLTAHSYGQAVVDSIRYMDTVTVRKQIRQMNGVNQLNLSLKQIEAVPKMFGMADPFKAIRFLPGFGNGGDANSGLLYRGLSSGNNGYFYNGVQVHNPSHLFGLFPLFNSNIVKEVNVYTSVVPGKFFGKLSGYIDIKSDWSIADTTLIKAEASLFHIGVGARIERDSIQMLEMFWRNTYMNKTLWPVLQNMVSDMEGLNYDLYDFNINAKRVFGKSAFKTYLYLGRDRSIFDLYDRNVKNRMDWGNLVLGLTHDKIINQYLQLENNIGFSTYDAQVGFNIFDDEFSIVKRQNNFNINTTLAYKRHRSTLETGFLYSIDLLKSKLKDGDELVSASKKDAYTSRQTFFKYFLNSKFFLSDKLEAATSVNVSAVSNVQQQLFLDPAFTLTYLVDQKNSFFGGASMSYQPLHQISLTSINIPVDYAVHSNQSLTVSKIKEISTGYRHMGKYAEFSVDSYYRWLNGAKEFDGNIITLHGKQDIVDGIIDGRGITYGLDFFTKVIFLRHYFTLNYSYSRSFRKFEAINNGSWYTYIYDRPHNLSIVHSYELTPKLALSSSFMFNSGSAYTPTVGLYHLNNAILAEYGAKNSARMPSFHRLDIGVEYLLRRTSKSKQTLGISIINLYNRSNPIYKYQSYNHNYLEKFGSFKMMQKNGAHLPILPSLTYSFELL